MVYKWLKLRYVVLVVTFIKLLVVGCTPLEVFPYEGDYPELFTVAINSILGTKGHRTPSIAGDVDVVVVVEVDSYGRTLFIYSESGAGVPAYLVISQKSDGEYVYFYPHYNFISIGRMATTRGFWPYIGTPMLMEALEESFTVEAIEELKRSNDWNQTLNLEGAVRTEIVDIKSDKVGPVNSRTLRQAYDQALGDDALGGAISSRTQFFIADDYGRSIYTAWGRERRRVVLLFQPDGSFDVERGVMELHDLQQYQNELKSFMELNGWNEPWDE